MSEHIQNQNSEERGGGVLDRIKGFLFVPATADRDPNLVFNTALRSLWSLLIAGALFFSLLFSALPATAMEFYRGIGNIERTLENAERQMVLLRGDPNYKLNRDYYKALGTAIDLSSVLFERERNDGGAYLERYADKLYRHTAEFISLLPPNGLSAEYANSQNEFAIASLDPKLHPTVTSYLDFVYTRNFRASLYFKTMEEIEWALYSRWLTLGDSMEFNPTFDIRFYEDLTRLLIDTSSLIDFELRRTNFIGYSIGYVLPNKIIYASDPTSFSAFFDWKYGQSDIRRLYHQITRSFYQVKSILLQPFSSFIAGSGGYSGDNLLLDTYRIKCIAEFAESMRSMMIVVHYTSYQDFQNFHLESLRWMEGVSPQNLMTTSPYSRAGIEFYLADFYTRLILPYYVQNS